MAKKFFKFFEEMKKIGNDLWWLAKENKNFLLLFLIFFLFGLFCFALGFLFCLYQIKIPPIIIEKNL